MDKKSSKALWPVLLTTMFASFMNPFMHSAVNIALPDIQEQFRCSAHTLGWITNSFLLANAMVLLPISKIADNWSRVKTFKAGLYLFTLLSFLIAFSPNIAVLLILRVLQGIGSAFMHVTGVAIITSAYPPQKRGTALGLNIGAVYAGLTLGPFLGGMLTHAGGWNRVFLGVVPLGILAIVLAHRNLENDVQKKQFRFDVPGSLVSALAILGIIWGGGRVNTLQGLFPWAFGLALLFVFFRLEKKQSDPILPLSLFQSNKLFAYSNMAALIHYAASSAVGFLLSLYLQFSRGLSPRDAGLVLVVQPALMVLTAPLAGRFSDKIRPGLLASLGMMLTLIGLSALVFLDEQTPLFVLMIILFLLGVGFGLFSSPNTHAIMGSVDRDLYGTASGTTATMRVLGQTLSMMVATLSISLFLKHAMLSPENLIPFIKSMKACFVFFALLCIPGIGFSVYRSGKPKMKNHKTGS
ncbi:MAG TPA: MFS transporter [Prolixibacteraceae bacterium]|nr:MFS transporter [Prolixibacteraceae bacterium]